MMRTIEVMDMEEGGYASLHDENLKRYCHSDHAHEDWTCEDAREDIVLIKNLASIELIEDLHEDESIEQH
jgi:hypothetical protein